jgi:hypothetical protein
MRLYSTADGIFIAAVAVLNRLNVQPKAAMIWGRYVVALAKKRTWDADSKPANEWFVLDGIEIQYREQTGEGVPALLRPFQTLYDGELENWIDNGAVVLNASRLIVEVLKRFQSLREARLSDRGKSIDRLTAEQLAYRVRKMQRAERKSSK